jgi:hypothetical protein
MYLLIMIGKPASVLRMLFKHKLPLYALPGVLLLFCMLLCLNVPCYAAEADESGTVCSLNVENDLFGGNSDRHFTHGTSINCLTRPVRLLTEMAAAIPWFDADQIRNNPLEARASITIGQNIYTPADISSTHLIKDDRPYAGWLYLGLGVVANQGSNRYDKIELDIGMIGPQSYAGFVQKTWHSLFNFRQPNGWEFQLKNEPGLVLFYEQARRIYKHNLLPGLNFDTIAHFGGSLGNVFTYANTGATFRIGGSLDKDFGPPRIRPSLPGSGYFTEKGFNWYIFAGVDGRAVLRNIFLDGNSFAQSHSVKKNVLVGDFQAGLALQVHRFKVTFTQIIRTKEFRGQNGPDQFGALSLSYLF